MGFQGQLSSVNLADIFQTLNMNRQTGTMSVVQGGQTYHIYFDQGDVCRASAPAVDGVPWLLAVLQRRGLLRAEDAGEVLQRARTSGQPLRDLVLVGSYVELAALDDVCSWCIEEAVCPLFELAEGEFTFTDGPPVEALQGLDMVEMGDSARVATTNLVLEATRRGDEWKRIREVLPDANPLLVVDNEGRANLRNLETDPEMQKVLRYLDGRHSLERVAALTGCTRFDTWAMAAQLVSAQVARSCSAADVVADAEALRAAGDLAKARDLLEIALAQARLPEVMRPLAEVCAQINQAPRAVELYLELIQADQDAGDLEGALRDLDTVIGLSPDDPELHYDRAQVLGELGRTEEAAGAFVSAAQTYIGTRDIQRAIDACHRAKNILPRAPEPHRWLARAYLLDGQTDNATVEYKALWHALLTAERPRKALEQLKSILDTDCKYAAIKEQVLSHASSSEAVKTGKAMRMLAYVAAGVVAVVAVVAGWEYYQRVVVATQGQERVTAIEKSMPGRKEALQHATAIEDLEEVRARYSGDRDLRERIDQLLRLVREDLDARAQGQLARGDALLAGSDFAGAERAYLELRDRYRGAAPAANAEARLEQVRQTRVSAEVQVQMADAQRRWQGLDWDGALARITAVLERKDLPTSLRSRLIELQVEWSASIRSAQRLSERAQKIEAAGNLRDALEAWRRAATGEGEQQAAAARDRARTLERDLATLIGRQAQDAAVKGDAQRSFSLLDELAKLAASAGGGVKEHLAGLEIPYTLAVDHHRTSLTIRRNGAAEQRIVAPHGTQGAWTHRLGYLPNETVTIIASRPGFSTQSATISAQARQVSGVVTLTRGPSWKADLAGPASVAPVFAGKQVLVGTVRATLEVIDQQLGTGRPVVFPDTVAEFRAPPFVIGNRAYLVIEDAVTCIDLAARTRAWRWPGQGESERRLSGPLWVHEHDLIQGQHLIFAQTSGKGMLTLGADQAGRAVVYPRLALDQEPTGPAVAVKLADHTILLVPAGNMLAAFDTTAMTEGSPAQPLFIARTRGDLVGRPTPAMVAGRSAVLVADTSGLVVAVDTDPRTPDPKRVIGSWALDGTAPSAPAVHGQYAFVNVAEGRVLGLDLAQPGPVRWRLPAGLGSLGTLAGEPAVGQRGIYVAGANGVLTCIEAATGRERWRCDLGQPVTGGLAARDGRVFVPVRSGQLWCFEEGED